MSSTDSVKAILELFFHTESFKNIDLCSQGLYQIRFTVHSEQKVGDSLQRCDAMPYSLIVGNRPNSFHLYSDNGLQQQIRGDAEYGSTAFRVQFSEQEISLNEGVVFRLEVNPTELTTVAVFVVVELCFAEYSSKDVALGKQIPKADELKCVATNTFRLTNTHQGIHFMQPVTFDYTHFGLLRMSVHSAMINYKFRHVGRVSLLAYNSIQNEIVRTEKRKNSISDFISSIFSSSESQQPPAQIPSIFSDISPVARCLFAQLLHSDEFITFDDLSLFADKVHRFFVNSLVYSYFSLSQFCVSMIDLLMKPKDIENFLSTCTACKEKIDLTGIANPSADSISSSSDASLFEIYNPIDQKSYNYSFPSLLALSSRLGSHFNLNSCAEMIQQDINAVSYQVFTLWQGFLTLLPKCESPLSDLLFLRWQQKSVEHWQAHWFDQKLTFADRWHISLQDSASLQITAADKIRSSNEIKNRLKPLAVENILMGTFAAPLMSQSVLFEKSYNLAVRNAAPSDLVKTHKMVSIFDFDHPDHFGEREEKVKATTDAIFLSLDDEKSNSSERRSSHGKSPSNEFKETMMKLQGISEIRSIDSFSVEELDLKMQSEYPGRHVWILCHGYQGNSWDMHLFKNIMSIMMPSVPEGNNVYFCSTINENDTEGDIFEMGNNLAQEVTNYIRKSVGVKNVGRISFVGHSLGGLIIRASLTHPDMAPYVKKLYTFISLATPHCGYLLSDNNIFNSGIYVLRNWYKSTCLNQLSMTDNDNPKETVLFKLSMMRGLEYFRNILLVTSPEDRYVPYHSARIEKPFGIDPVNDSWGSVYSAMVDNLLQPLTENSSFSRIDVSFIHDKTQLDNVIGRAAHICFLDSEQYMWMLIYGKRKYFL